MIAPNPHFPTSGDVTDRCHLTSLSNTESPKTNRGVTLAPPHVCFLPHHYGLTIVPHDQKVDVGLVVDHLKATVTSALVAAGATSDVGWFRQARAWQGYRHYWATPVGARIGVDPVELTREGNRHFQLCLSGSCCDLLALPVQRQILGALKSSYTLRCNRIDLAFDSEVLTVSDIWKACCRRDLHVRFRIKMDDPNPKTNSIRREVTEGIGGASWSTVYLGSRSSGRMARVYDYRGVPRIELELKGEQAQRCFEQVITGPAPDADLPGTCMGLLRDFVDFVDRRSAAALGNCRLLPWWKKFTGSVPTVRMAAATRDSSADATRAWLINSVSPSLAAVADLEPDPEQFVIDLYQEGHRRVLARIERSSNRARAATLAVQH